MARYVCRCGVCERELYTLPPFFVHKNTASLRTEKRRRKSGKTVYVICQSGLRSYIATRILEGYGFEAYNFAGGFRFYDAVMNDRALIEASFACGMDK